MLVFLAPAALAGLLLLSVPIVLHLFRPQRVKVVPFSSLRWLRASQHKLSRRIRWHQVLLFLLRAGLIALAALALARPVFTAGGRRARVDRLIVLDASRAMTMQGADQSMLMDRARTVAETLLWNARPGDRTAVLASGAEPMVLGPLMSEPDMLRKKVSSVQPGLADAPVTAALPLAPALLDAAAREASVELYVVTAHRAASWVHRDVARLLERMPEDLRVRVVDVGLEQPRQAWIAEARVLDEGDSYRVRAVVAGVGDPPQSRTLRLSGLQGGGENARRLTIEERQPVTVEFEAPKQAVRAGDALRLTLEPRDALPSDDEWWLVPDPRGLTRVLILATADARAPELQPAFHLRMALAALAEGQPGVLGVEQKTPEEATPADVAAAHIVVLADVGGLSEALAEALKERVTAGGGAMIFLGPRTEPGAYGHWVRQSGRPGEGLLPGPVGERVEAVPAFGRLLPFAEADWSHPLLSALSDPTMSDLGQVVWREFRRISVSGADGEARILATIGGQAPALVEHRRGAGRVLVVNATANDAWSDWPRRRSFVPFVDRAVRYLAGGTATRAVYEVGDAITVPLPHADPEQAAVVTTPGGELRLRPRRLGGQPFLQLDAAVEPGLYRVRYQTIAGEEALTFVVQTPRRYSPMTPADDAVLREWWRPASYEVLTPEAVARQATSGGLRWPLEPWLMALAALLLAAETWLAAWVCPRVHPPIATESAVAQHGFFRRPTAELSREERRP